jgi:hypothetical protein
LVTIISFFDRDSPFMRSSRLIATLKTLCKILHRQTLHACSVALPMETAFRRSYRRGHTRSHLELGS